jgi:hypothetical protein
LLCEKVARTEVTEHIVVHLRLALLVSFTQTLWFFHSKETAPRLLAHELGHFALIKDFKRGTEDGAEDGGESGKRLLRDLWFIAWQCFFCLKAFVLDLSKYCFE